MLLTVEALRMRVPETSLVDNAISGKLEAIESIIRAYTNNNFQVRAIRFYAESSGGALLGVSPYLRLGDTVQVSESSVNNGLYVVTALGGESTTLDQQLFEVPHNLVTKVEYPADVVQCAVDLFRWSQTYGGKIGVKSETLSRHSVSYEDSATLYMGYPVGILSGLKLYRKARC